MATAATRIGPLGAVPVERELVEFRVWAPNAKQVSVAGCPLEPEGDGFFAGTAALARGDYRFELDGRALADPCSRWQPDGLRGDSSVLDTGTFEWSSDPIAVPLAELVIYELHVGTFTAEGTFDAAAARLDALAELGITAVELMPVATFPGERGWGYDGVLVFAPHRAYGGPHGLARFVDAAHSAGLAVILDVVYNHVGPGSELLSAYGPYFTGRYDTFWGDAIDFSLRGVREWAIQNAELWVRDYRIDGLRLDATHAIFDDNEPHIMVELARRVRAAHPGALVISEIEREDRRPIEEWQHDAQWADDFHHALHVLLTGERDGYYEPYGKVADLAHAYGLEPAERLVICAQNHDQIGNRAVGDRLAPSLRRLAAACLLFAPQVPILFMGEEYGETARFQFFTDHDDPAIAEATREGRRRKEFAKFASFAGRGRARPAGRLDVRALEAASRARRRRAPRILRRADRASAPASGRGRDHRRRDAANAERSARRHRARRRLREPDGRAASNEAGPLMKVWPGEPFPLGATWDGEGTNFSLFSENAERVELCLYDGNGANETRVELTERTAFNWHCYLPGVGPGQRYGYRVHGPYEPEAGKRFNAMKLLIDPYAKAIDGVVDHTAANVMPYVPDGEDADLYFDDEDDADAVPKCLVVDTSFDWEGDALPRRPWSETIIYEAHTKGFTKLNEQIREDLRGTYAGLASDEAIAYLRSLGVTAVELLPIHHIADENHLVERGLTNYWGYSTIGYLAPHSGYAATGARGEQVREFKGMVKALHRAGIEVILDVVYNHTAEGGHLGPTLSFRGIDNESYYRLMPDTPRFYMDYTGTGNSLNPAHPNVLRLIMDSLRYFADDCHVDGFRFDLASALAREFFEVGRLSAFFDIIHQDPVLSQVKLIAEPWDVGEGGYQVGNFPVLWAEWNGPYRDVMRDFWRGQARVGDFAGRFTGSADLFAKDGRKPSASINFVTAHDGFTLNDLVSYNEKHNEANLEGNRDGTDDNRSWNCGVEGATDDPAILALRARQRRNLLATLLLSQGVPMLLGGDEIARTQGGNNNAYCQDNEISWIHWAEQQRHRGLQEFTRRLISLRRAHPVFRQSSFLDGDLSTSKLPDVWWFRPDGRKMTRRDWEGAAGPRIGIFLNGSELRMRTPRGEPVVDDSFLILFNAHYEDIVFTLPPRRFGLHWALELTTSDPDAGAMTYPARAEVGVQSRSLVVACAE